MRCVSIGLRAFLLEARRFGRSSIPAPCVDKARGFEGTTAAAWFETAEGHFDFYCQVQNERATCARFPT